MNQIVVLIIDTGVAAVMGLGGYFKDPPPVTHMHGTGVAYIATGLEEKIPVCGQVKFVECNWYKTSYTYSCLNEALAMPQLDFINLSVQGEQFDIREYWKLKALTERGVIVTVAAGNHGIKDISKGGSYPSGYLYHGLTNYRVVTDPGLEMSDLGPGLIEDDGTTMMPITNTVVVPAEGTSFAAPRYLRKLLTSYCNELRMFNSGEEIMCSK